MLERILFKEAQVMTFSQVVEEMTIFLARTATT
jgi:hypothetical protein